MPDDQHAQTDILAKICVDTLAEVDRRRTLMPLAVLKHKVAHMHRRDAPRGFADALSTALMGNRCGLIAEIKRTSPSGGVVRAGLDVPSVARDYQAGGAVCLSVLTDGPYFGGSIADLQAAKAAVPLPVLRKDFILDPWQVYESRLVGADCILLIMAALTDAEAIALEQLARDLDLDVLVEVHDQRELERALGLQTKLIGINNRNLKTLETDIETTIELAPMVSCERMLVTESGIRGHEDLKRLAAVGAHCLLVGESLLRQDDLVAATKDLLGCDKCVG
jgi:indole-3-glycerol phosphate synthase